MRGKQVNSEKGDCTLWITPAGAGKTHSFCRKPRCCRDHPRRCGENLKKLSWAMTGLGSPPQVRGKRIKLSGKKLRMRITPAGAGKTEYLLLSQVKSPDHPRRCGENSFLIYFFKPIAGSPPQVRGKHCDCVAQSCSFRITPAGAGKTKTRYASM